MTNALIPAAPSRLRKAAKAGAGRFVTACVRDTQRQAVMLAQWCRAARQVQWIYRCPGIRKGPLMGPGLLHWCAPKPDREPLVRKKSFKQEPAKPVFSGSETRTKPRFADFPHSDRPQPTAQPCSAAVDGARALPTRLAAGKLRLLAKTDPGPVSKRTPPLRAPQPVQKVATPRSAMQPDWQSALTDRAAIRLCPPTGVAKTKASITSGWAQQIQGPAASLPLLEKALCHVGETMSEAQGKPSKAKTKKTAKGRESPSASDIQKRALSRNPVPAVDMATDTPPTAAHTEATSSAQSKNLGGVSAPLGDSHATDALEFRTLSPPVHASPVALPPQPDIARATTVTPREPRQPDPDNPAVSDEPLSELPPPAPHKARSPGFGSRPTIHVRPKSEA